MKPYQRRSIRLKNYDYSKPGAYFVTICVNLGKCCLGEVRDGVMDPSLAGEMAADCWHDLPQRFPNVELDAFSLMPNHVHGILAIEEAGIDAKNKPVVLGSIVGGL